MLKGFLKRSAMHNYREAVILGNTLHSNSIMHSYREAVREHVSTLSKVWRVKINGILNPSLNPRFQLG